MSRWALWDRVFPLTCSLALFKSNWVDELLNSISFVKSSWGEHVYKMSESVAHPLETNQSGRKKNTLWCHRVSFYSREQATQRFHGLPLNCTGKITEWHIWGCFKATVWWGLCSRHAVQLWLDGSTMVHKPHWGKLPNVRRRLWQNGLHFLLHSTAITFVAQANRSGVPLVTTARPSLQGAHAPVV